MTQYTLLLSLAIGGPLGQGPGVEADADRMLCTVRPRPPGELGILSAPEVSLHGYVRPRTTVEDALAGVFIAPAVSHRLWVADGQKVRHSQEADEGSKQAREQKSTPLPGKPWLAEALGYPIF